MYSSRSVVDYLDSMHQVTPRQPIDRPSNIRWECSLAFGTSAFYLHRYVFGFIN